MCKPNALTVYLFSTIKDLILCKLISPAKNPRSHLQCLLFLWKLACACLHILTYSLTCEYLLVCMHTLTSSGNYIIFLFLNHTDLFTYLKIKNQIGKRQSAWKKYILYLFNIIQCIYSSVKHLSRAVYLFWK